MRRILVSLLMVAGAVTSVIAMGHGATSDSGIEGPRYKVIQQRLRQLITKFPNHLQLVSYGTSVRGQSLQLLKIHAKQRTARSEVLPMRPAVLITGVTHGNEYLNIVDRLPQALLERKNALMGVSSFIESGGVVYILPVLNPDGFDDDQRANANGIDLNRDFPLLPQSRPGFEQPETRALVQYLEKDLKQHGLTLRVSMDYHCCMGALLYPWSYTAKAIPATDLDAHQRIAHKMVEILGKSYRHGTTQEILGYRPHGTSKDYYYPKFGALTFTFEGRYRIEQGNFDKHLAWWDWILGDLVPARLAAR